MFTRSHTYLLSNIFGIVISMILGSSAPIVHAQDDDQFYWDTSLRIEDAEQLELSKTTQGMQQMSIRNVNRSSLALMILPNVLDLPKPVSVPNGSTSQKNEHQNNKFKLFHLVNSPPKNRIS